MLGSLLGSGERSGYRDNWQTARQKPHTGAFLCIVNPNARTSLNQAVSAKLHGHNVTICQCQNEAFVKMHRGLYIIFVAGTRQPANLARANRQIELLVLAEQSSTGGLFVPQDHRVRRHLYRKMVATLRTQSHLFPNCAH